MVDIFVITKLSASMMFRIMIMIDGKEDERVVPHPYHFEGFIAFHNDILIRLPMKHEVYIL